MSNQPESERVGERVADDILRGAEEIGGELGITAEEVYYIYSKLQEAIREGDVKAAAATYPITKLNGKLVASRRELRRAHKRITAALVHPP
jgi:hypothetical protein